MIWIISDHITSISQIRSSGQRIEYFEQLQASCKIPAPFKKLEVHNNTRWGTAYGMVKRALELRQVLSHFFNFSTKLIIIAAHQSIHLGRRWSFRSNHHHSYKREDRQEDSLVGVLAIWKWLGSRRRCSTDFEGRLTTSFLSIWFYYNSNLGCS